MSVAPGLQVSCFPGRYSLTGTDVSAVEEVA